MHLSSVKKKKSSYSTEYNLETIKFAKESKSIYSAAKKFNVDHKRICEWQSTKAKLQAADNKRKCLDEETICCWPGRRAFREDT